MLGEIKSFLVRFSLFRWVQYKWTVIRYFRAHALLLNKVRQSGRASICFLVSSLPMWRLQDFYELLAKDSRFSLQIILLPFQTYAPKERDRCMRELKQFFDKRNCPYEMFDSPSIQNQWKERRPDIIFYQQLYSTIYPEPFEIDLNLDKLICFIPYSLMTCRGDWVYNTKHTNVAWKLFYPTRMHLDFARRHSFNRAGNVSVVGEPNAVKYLSSAYAFPWKPQSEGRPKRVIWAPHFSISETGYLHRASFLWMAELMKEIVRQYEGRIQFVLKPHPRLVSSLYSHPDWGEEKTNRYFDWWNSAPNAQVETGQYIDLFMTSDAMIHDCGSFTAEYLYTNKPVLFVSNDFKGAYSSLDYFGTKCMDLHYKGGSEEDVFSFLDKVVLGEDDPLAAERRRFYDDILVNEASREVGKNIYQIMTQELFSTDS